MQKNKNVVRSLVSAVAAGILFSASSATMADDTAVASSILTLKFDPTIEIALIDDITIENPELGDPAIGTEEFCIGGLGFSTYSITFDSSVNAGAFTLTDGGSITILTVLVSTTALRALSPLSRQELLSPHKLPMPFPVLALLTMPDSRSL